MVYHFRNIIIIKYKYQNNLPIHIQCHHILDNRCLIPRHLSSNGYPHLKIRVIIESYVTSVIIWWLKTTKTFSQICLDIIWNVIREKSSGALFVEHIAPLVTLRCRDIRLKSIHAIWSLNIYLIQRNVFLFQMVHQFKLCQWSMRSMTRIHCLPILRFLSNYQIKT